MKETPIGRQVVEMPELRARKLTRLNPHLLVEEGRELRLFPMPDIPPVVVTEPGYSVSISVRDKATGHPIPKVTIFAIGSAAVYKAVTDIRGAARLTTGEPLLDRLIVSAADTYWSRVLTSVDAGRTTRLDVRLRRLPTAGRYTWGHRFVGSTACTVVGPGSGPGSG